MTLFQRKKYRSKKILSVPILAKKNLKKRERERQTECQHNKHNHNKGKDIKNNSLWTNPDVSTAMQTIAAHSQPEHVPNRNFLLQPWVTKDHIYLTHCNQHQRKCKRLKSVQYFVNDEHKSYLLTSQGTNTIFCMILDSLIFWLKNTFFKTWFLSPIFFKMQR